jgi:hypothetical protein
MPYAYDVFISYSHDYPFGEWVADPFLPMFKGYLKASLGREANLFIDEGIRIGAAWAETLKNALANSRCMVGVWSPNYFLSEWCRYECIVMLHRERKLQYRTSEKPSGLVVPVSVHDGDRFPDYAQAVQFANWVQFARIGEGFKKTESFVEFQDQLDRFASDVAAAITGAPPWQEEWITDEWLDNAIPEWDKLMNTNLKTVITDFAAPSLASEPKK